MTPCTPTRYLRRKFCGAKCISDAVFLPKLASFITVFSAMVHSQIHGNYDYKDC